MKYVCVCYVFYSADNNIKSLIHIKSILSAERGVGGRANNMDGKNAPHLYVKVRNSNQPIKNYIWLNK